MGGDGTQGQPREICLHRSHLEGEKAFKNISNWGSVLRSNLAVDPVCDVAACRLHPKGGVSHGYSMKESASTTSQHRGLLGRHFVRSIPKHFSSFVIFSF